MMTRRQKQTLLDFHLEASTFYFSSSFGALVDLRRTPTTHLFSLHLPVIQSHLRSN